MEVGSQWTTMDDDGFIGLVGPIAHQVVDEGIGRFRFHAEAKHRNRSGTVHGGMLMAFADRGMGATARQRDPSLRTTTVQLDMHFMEPALIGNVVDLECRVLKKTRHLLFLDGTISSAGHVLATARGVWKILRSSTSELPPSA